MEELEQRFGSNLCLSQKERVGIQIAAEKCGDLWKGSSVTLVARVLTNWAVQIEGFIGMFTRLWRGMDGVSIKEIGERRFQVRFANKKDKLRVLDMEPWTSSESLVLLAETHVGMDAREMEVGTVPSGVQFHGIPPFNMATLVARKIGRTCVEKLVEDRVPVDTKKEILKSYAGLEAEEDLRGRRLQSGGHSGFKGGAGSDGSKHESDALRTL
ncbi:uncharacterized protein Pyn_34738 [Prunus yedoensis var. nudiflora]|uniref:DUF4283 domain-containing protein n=1 Tax=Prunus yedoensis var. nudiflora TaxID=2094558 RepID=A0A314YAJ3_PRUYE|nr:uncharacterized protein Pyn_34738 [Prunus yedoensis var. nudiflora]